MKRILVFIAVLATSLLVGCGSGSQPRSEPFVGQWESTGGQKIGMTVAAPANESYAVRITGENVDLSLSAKKSGDQAYTAKSTSATWTFTMVDDELLTATAEVKDRAPVATSFKRIGD